MPSDRRSPRELLLFAFFLAITVALAWLLRHALLIIYVSAVFAVVLTPAIDRVHTIPIFRWHPSRGVSLLLVLLLLCLLLAGIMAVAVPSIASDAADFTQTLPRQVSELQRRLHSIPLFKKLDLSSLPAYAATTLKWIGAAAASTAADVLTSVLLTAYFILDGAPLLRRIVATLPPSQQPRLGVALGKAAGRMRHWLAGQGLLMLILGSSATITFGLMGLPFFYLLGFFAGLANFVPLLGPIATVLLAGIVAATQSGLAVIGVIAFYFVYQQVENAFLTPKIMKSQVQLASPAVIIALLIGSELAGIAGALVAIPSAVLVSELAQEYLPEKRSPSITNDQLQQ